MINSGESHGHSRLTVSFTSRIKNLDGYTGPCYLVGDSLQAMMGKQHKL